MQGVTQHRACIELQRVPLCFVPLLIVLILAFENLPEGRALLFVSR